MSGGYTLPITQYQEWWDALVHDRASVVDEHLKRQSPAMREKLVSGRFDYEDSEWNDPKESAKVLN